MKLLSKIIARVARKILRSPKSYRICENILTFEKIGLSCHCIGREQVIPVKKIQINAYKLEVIYIFLNL